MNGNDLCLIVMDNCKELGEKVNKHLMKIRGVKKSFRGKVFR